MPKTGRQTISKKTLRDAEKQLLEFADQIKKLVLSMDKKTVSEFEAMNKPAYDEGVKKVGKFIRTCIDKVSDL